MSYQLSISKEDINKLPLYVFPGKIVLIESEPEAFAAAEAMEGEIVLGFDTETKAAFRKGERYDVSMLQLATNTHAYLFRLNKFSMPKEIINILENPSIIKAGVAIHDDIKALKKLTPFEDKGFVDLAKLAKEKQVINFGLRALTAIYLGRRLSKKANISNWERKHLNATQIEYAACDAAVGYLIYEKISKQE